MRADLEVNQTHLCSIKERREQASNTTHALETHKHKCCCCCVCVFDPSAFTGAFMPHTIKTSQSLMQYWVRLFDSKAGGTEGFVANSIGARNVVFFYSLGFSSKQVGYGYSTSMEGRGRSTWMEKLRGFIQLAGNTSCSRFEVLVTIFDIT